MKDHRKQSGFTIIELILVIVILGVLSAVALPKFIDLRTDAEDAAIGGVAAAAASAMTVNYAGCQVTSNAPTANKCIAVAACADIDALLQGGLPAGYIASGTIGAGNGASAVCTLTKTVGTAVYTATFAGIRAGT